MADIISNTEEKIFSIGAWGGLHECPDGDTKLKMGEAAVMRNFCITRDGNLRRRAGTKAIINLGAEVKCLWSGRVADEDVLLAAAGGHLWKLINTGEEWASADCGELETNGSVYIFPFDTKAYILNGHEYYEWDGEALSAVIGYRPLVAISIPPLGGGELLEGVNKLNGLRHCFISPDGEAVEFKLPEENIASIDFVKSAVDDTAIDGWSANLEEGKITFSTAPIKGVNTVDIGYSMAVNYRSDITRMKYSELYDGTQDTRVFVYGDGSNQCIYSDIDYYGKARADYFPDLNVCSIGEANTPITGLCRHYSSLICFKSNSTWRIEATTTQLADELITRAFYIVPVNKSIGNEALGQVQNVLNNPRTLHGADIYEWRSNNRTSDLTRDERQAIRISDRITATMKQFKLSDCVCFDDNYNQEYYVFYNGNALVNNYAANAWYYYTGIDAKAIVSHKNEVYFGTSDGKVMHFSYAYLSDETFSERAKAIDSYWESGSMSFGRDYNRKYSAYMWIGLKPESGSKITVTLQTDKKSRYAEKAVTTDLAGFGSVDFSDFSFNTNRKPHMTKLKIKAKKFVFLKLIFSDDSLGKTSTVLAADIKVRYTGMAK